MDFGITSSNPLAASLDDRQGHRGHSLASASALLQEGPRLHSSEDGASCASAKTLVSPRGVTRGDFRTRLAKRIFLKTLEDVRSGFLELACSDGVYSFGSPADPPHATIVVHDDRFFGRSLFGADIGIGESYMDGD